MSLQARTLTPGTIVRTNKGALNEAIFVVLPSTMSGWTNALQVSGQGILPGELFHRGAPVKEGVFGKEYEILKQYEYRMLASDGSIRGALVLKGDL